MREPVPVRPGKCVCACIYGLSGSGKTKLLGTANSALIIRPPTDHTDSIQDASGVEELVVEDHNQLLEAFQWVQQGGGKRFDWVALDTISLLEDHGLDDVFQAAIDRAPHRAEHGPDKGEYGINRSRLTKWLRDMVGLSKAGQFNFVVTANIMSIFDPVREQELWVPQFGSQQSTLHAKLCGYMNVVAYLNATEKRGKPRQELLTVDSDGFVGKDQYGCFPELKSGRHGFTNPTMADIESALGKAMRKRPAKRTGARKRTRRK